jgi:glyoxylase-like metal-dependent hydrolase (beta-lactamase superfamily II)
MYRILDGIYTVEGLRVGRVYVIESNDGLTLIDTSLPGSLPQIEKELQKIGHQLGETKRILITHAHGDHVGSLAALKDATGAQVYAHQRYESAVIRGEKPPLYPAPSQLHSISRFLVSRMKRQKVPAAQVDYEFQCGDRIDEALPGLEVVDLPGHSPGHCGFWQAEKRLLFAGDVMMRLFSGLRLPPAMVTPDMEETKRSIRKVAEMNVETLCLGHGKPYDHDAEPAVRTFADKLS